MLHQEGTLVTCPYNTAHLIRPQRMQTHLVKCRKSNITQDHAVCPLDATHHVPSKELQFHLATCSKRAVVEKAIYKQTSGRPVVPQLAPEVIQSILPESEESWEDDCAPTYNPLEQTANKNVIRIMKGAPPAERKAFQLAERRRLVELQEEAKKNAPIKIISRDNNASDAVRLPMNPSKAYNLCARQADQSQ